MTKERWFGINVMLNLFQYQHDKEEVVRLPEVILERDRKLAIFLLSLIIILAPFDYGFLDLQILTINLVLALLLIFIWAVSSIRKGGVELCLNSITVSICLFFLIVSFSLVYSIRPYSSLTEVMRHFTYIAVFFSSASLLSDKDFRKLFQLVVIWMGLLAVYGLWEYSSGEGQGTKSVFAVYHGTFAAYLLLTFPLAFGLMKYKPYFLLPGLLGILALAATQSRCAWVSFIMGGLVSLPLLIKFRGRIKLRVGIVLALTFVFFFAYDYLFMDSVLIKRLATLPSPGGVPSAQARVKYWGSALEITKQYLPAGTGIQTFYLIYPFYKHPSFAGCTHHFVHNDYLQLLSEIGPLGLIAFLGIVFSYLFHLRSAINRPVKEKPFNGVGNRGLLLAIYLSSLSFFFGCIFEFNIYIPSLMILMYLYIAFASRGTKRFIKIHPKGYLFIYPLLFAAIILAVFPYAGQLFAERGNAALKSGDISSAITDYKAASFFSPLNTFSHRALAEVYLSQGKEKEALEECINAIRLNPFVKKNHELLGDIFNETK